MARGVHLIGTKQDFDPDIPFIFPVQSYNVVKYSSGRPLVPEKRSPLQTIAVVCVKLDQGESEEKIMEYLDIEDDLYTFCVEFALENNNLIRHDGRIKITICGKEFISVF
jgi:hypothetical protein